MLRNQAVESKKKTLDEMLLLWYNGPVCERVCVCACVSVSGLHLDYSKDRDRAATFVSS